jgi:hypothetical protein
MTTRSTLISDIAAWLVDDDITNMEPTFIRMAEASIRRDVRCRAMETSASVSIVDGSCSVPDRFIQARRLIMDNQTAWNLDYVPPEVLYSSAIYRESGLAAAYTLEGDTLVFRPATTETGLLLYLAAFTPLVNNQDTNWLLTNAYDIYLYGALRHSAPYLRDDGRVSIWDAGYRDAITALNRQENYARIGGSPLRVMGVSGP